LETYRKNIFDSEMINDQREFLSNKRYVSLNDEKRIYVHLLLSFCMYKY